MKNLLAYIAVILVLFCVIYFSFFYKGSKKETSSNTNNSASTTKTNNSNNSGKNNNSNTKNNNSNNNNSNANTNLNTNTNSTTENTNTNSNNSNSYTNISADPTYDPVLDEMNQQRNRVNKWINSSININQQNPYENNTNSSVVETNQIAQTTPQAPTTANQEPKVIYVREISLSKTTSNLTVGGKDTIFAQVLPKNAENKNITWSTDDDRVAVVDSNGKITGAGPGSTTISARSYNGITSTVTVNVTNDSSVSSIIEVSSVTLNKTNLSLTTGETQNLIATVLPDNAFNKNITWTSTNPSIASVNNGLVRANSEGIAIITAKGSNDKTATCIVTVTDPVNTNIEVSSITLNKTNINLEKDHTETLVAIINPNNATDKTITWTSSDPSIASVSASGVVEGISKGEAVITARSVNNKTATCTVNVTETTVIPTVYATSVVLDKENINLEIGASDKINATVNPSDTTNKLITWTSSDSTVASVDATGNVTGVGSGTAIITASTVNNITSTCIITVSSPIINVATVTLDIDSKTLEVGDSYSLVATVLPSNATNKTLTWTSSNPTAVSVDQSGNITAIGGGVSVITARANNNVYAQSTIIVNEPNVHLFGLSQEYVNQKYGPILEGLFATINPTEEVIDTDNSSDIEIGNAYQFHFPDIVYKDGTYYAYYIYNDYAIGLATSSDGLNFTNHGPVITPSEDYDSVATYFAGVWYEESEQKFYLTYEAKGTGDYDLESIALATSYDGINWTKEGLILRRDENLSWQSANVGTPDLYKIGDTWYLTFHGFDYTDCQIGLAYGTDLHNLTVVDTPIIPTVAESLKSGTAGRRDIIYVNGYYYMVYEVSTDSVAGDFGQARWTHEFARSQDMINWQSVPNGPLLIQKDSLNNETVGFGYDGPCWMITKDNIYVYFRNKDNGTSRAILFNSSISGLD